MNDFINDGLEAFPLPEEAIILDEKINLSVRQIVIKALEKTIKERNLDFKLGPVLNLNDPSRSIILNKFDIQITTSSLISDETTFSLKNTSLKKSYRLICPLPQLKNQRSILIGQLY